MKVRSVIATAALAASTLVAGAASADAATTVDRHIDTRASYYDTQPANTIVNSWHGHPVVYVDGSSGAYGYTTCSGGMASPIYVTVYAVRDRIALNVVKHEFTHVIACWSGDQGRYSDSFNEHVAEAGQMLQGGTDKRTETSGVWVHARYLLNTYLVTG